MGTDKKEMTKALRTQIIVSSLLFFVGIPVLALLDHKPEGATASAPAERATIEYAPIDNTPVPEAEASAQTTKENDALAEWAMRAHNAEQAQEDRCWDQLESGSLRDVACY